MMTLFVLILAAIYCWLWWKSYQALMDSVRRDLKAVIDQAFEPLEQDLASLQKKITEYEAGHMRFLEHHKTEWGIDREFLQN